MKTVSHNFHYEVYNDINEMPDADAALVMKAREMTSNAYAPYSNFKVGAVAKLSNGEIVAGTNQENASYPVGICAERVLLGNAATLWKDISIETMAISYSSDSVISDHPISPCGMCRQALLEYETRTQHPFRLILAGQSGKIQVIPKASLLLPFAFTSEELSQPITVLP